MRVAHTLSQGLVEFARLTEAGSCIRTSSCDQTSIFCKRLCSIRHTGVPEAASLTSNMASNDKSLNVIGLISGGKDSFYSLLHCLANDHRIVALANLYPPPPSSPSNKSEDLNSFMYQTAGHAVIPLYSEALDLPLYRQEIHGSALNRSKDYHTTPEGGSGNDSGNIATQNDGDETESLLPLLKQIIAAHPTANAVCTGAILSTYQRTRVESVARRLNLVALSYLWQYPLLPPQSPGGLLDDMAAIGFDVRIVKVASGGLGEELLWGNLMDAAVKDRVEKGVNRFGGSVLGEGGEYETLVLDGPTPLWKGHLVVRPDEMWTGNSGGGEASIGFREGCGVIVTKYNDSPMEVKEWKSRIRRPRLWDKEFELLSSKISQPFVRFIPSNNAWQAKLVICKNQSILTLSNLTNPLYGFNARRQMLAVNANIMFVLSRYNISSADNIIFTTILLRTMADFASVNDAYGQLFTKPNPPARVTVACGNMLPSGADVMVSVIVSLDIASREGLHVQSRSYWAPANIGPYSQAVSTPLQQSGLEIRLVYIAGQIPLVPASMEILRAEDGDDNDAPCLSISSFHKQACLALQNLWRVGKTMNVSWWTDAVAFIAGERDASEKAVVAWEIWEKVHQPETWGYTNQEEEDDDDLEGLDAWDLKYGGLGSLAKSQSKSQGLPDFERLSNQTSYNAPHFLAVEVDGLPRGCEIEWQSSGIAYHNASTSAVQDLFTYKSIVWDDADTTDEQICTKILEALDVGHKTEDFDAKLYTSRPDLVQDLSIQVIPCISVWGPAGQQLVAAIAIRNTAAT